ncbi:MAG: adenylyl-sulfate kinase [Polyangia bacterium]
MNERKATNITWHEQQITTADLAELHGHKGCTIWFTGLSGSGKSTLANATAAALHQRGVSTFVLDGDNVRHGLNKNLGFSAEDRQENIRRIGEVAKLFSSAAVINLTAFISPYRADRDQARALQPDSFFEIFCDAKLEICENRDPKGLYKKARAGEIKGFTGIDDPYEAPEKPELVVDTGELSIEQCVERVIGVLTERGVLKSD